MTYNFPLLTHSGTLSKNLICIVNLVPQSCVASEVKKYFLGDTYHCSLELHMSLSTNQASEKSTPSLRLRQTTFSPWLSMLEMVDWNLSSIGVENQKYTLQMFGIPTTFLLVSFTQQGILFLINVINADLAVVGINLTLQYKIICIHPYYQ